MEEHNVVDEMDRSILRILSAHDCPHCTVSSSDIILMVHNLSERRTLIGPIRGA